MLTHRKKQESKFLEQCHFVGERKDSVYMSAGWHLDNFNKHYVVLSCTQSVLYV